jgi:hypothetical protein
MTSPRGRNKVCLKTPIFGSGLRTFTYSACRSHSPSEVGVGDGEVPTP